MTSNEQYVGYPPPQGAYPPQQAPYPPPHMAYPPPNVYPAQPVSYMASPAGYPVQGPPAPGFKTDFNPGYPPSGYPSGEPQPPPYSEYPASGGYSNQPSNPNADKLNVSSLNSNQMFGGGFSEKSIRMAFIRKVYLILMCQILATVGIIALVIFEEKTNKFVRANTWLYYVSYGTFLVTYITLACCPSVRRKHPTNIIMLCIFTLALSYMVAMISSYHKTEIVFYSMAICAVICLGITLFAIQTRFDFTLCGSFLFIAVLVLFVFGILAIFIRDRTVQLVYSALIALLFSLFLAYDTQMIVGGRRHEMSPEEYVFGALQLYLDVIYIFTAILSIFGNSK